MRKQKLSKYKDKSIKELRGIGTMLGVEVDRGAGKITKWYLKVPGQTMLRAVHRRQYFPRERIAWITGIEWVRKHKLGGAQQ